VRSLFSFSPPCLLCLFCCELAERVVEKERQKKKKKTPNAEACFGGGVGPVCLVCSKEKEKRRELPIIQQNKTKMKKTHKTPNKNKKENAGKGRMPSGGVLVTLSNRVLSATREGRGAPTGRREKTCDDWERSCESRQQEDSVGETRAVRWEVRLETQDSKQTKQKDISVLFRRRALPLCDTCPPSLALCGLLPHSLLLFSCFSLFLVFVLCSTLGRHFLRCKQKKKGKWGKQWCKKGATRKKKRGERRTVKKSVWNACETRALEGCTGAGEAVA